MQQSHNVKLATFIPNHGGPENCLHLSQLEKKHVKKCRQTKSFRNLLNWKKETRTSDFSIKQEEGRLEEACINN